MVVMDSSLQKKVAGQESFGLWVLEVKLRLLETMLVFPGEAREDLDLLKRKTTLPTAHKISGLNLACLFPVVLH